MAAKLNLQWTATDYGFVYMGLLACTEQDMEDLRDYTRQDNPQIDPGTTVGRYDRMWHCEEESLQYVGGEGSHTYECQNVGTGVEFKPADQGPCFHINPEGEYVHAAVDYPCTGRAFHRDEYNSTVAGPAPNSDAEFLLGGGCYAWDDDNAWWVVEE